MKKFNCMGVVYILFFFYILSEWNRLLLSNIFQKYLTKWIFSIIGLESRVTSPELFLKCLFIRTCSKMGSCKKLCKIHWTNLFNDRHRILSTYGGWIWFRNICTKFVLCYTMLYKIYTKVVVTFLSISRC